MTIVRSAPGHWVMCDDENIEPIEESDLANYFGDNITGAGYVMFYQAVNLDLKSLGLKKEPKPRSLPPAPRVAAVVDDEVVTSGTSGPTTPLDHYTPHMLHAAPVSPSKSQSTPLPIHVHKDNTLDVPAPPRRASSGVSRDTSPSNRWSHHAGGPVSHSPGEKGKWYSLKKKEGSSSSGDPRMLRQSASTTAATTTPTESVDLLMSQSMSAMSDNRMSQSFHDGAHTDLSASIRSHTSASSNGNPTSHTNGGATTAITAFTPHNGHAYPTSDTNGTASPHPSVPTLSVSSHSTGASPGNGNPNGTADRTSRIGRSATSSRVDRVSNVSMNQNGYSGGSGLGRKISGATGFSSLARRSSNAFKIGFGKKKQEEQ